MKRIALLMLLLIVGVILIISQIYPQTYMLLEGDSFFQMTADFWHLKLKDMPALCTWMQDFLLQFYRWPLAAGAINAIVLSLTTLWGVLIHYTLKKGTMMEGAIALPLILFAAIPLELNIHLEACMFMLCLWLYLTIRPVWGRIIWLLALVPLGYLSLSMPLLYLLYLLYAAAEFWHFRSGRWYLPLAGLVLVLFCPTIYSQQVTFVPYKNRYFYLRAVQDDLKWIYYMAYVVSLASLLIPIQKIRNVKVRTIIPSTLAVLAIVVAMFTLANNKGRRMSEEFYNFQNLAEQGKWTELQNALHRYKGVENKAKMCYSLLAESAQGTLPENLFSYPINSPEDFLFRHVDETYAMQFNRVFYATMGVYDEAFHQAEEYYLRQVDGVCFSSLRQMADYDIQVAEFPVSEKFLDVLDKSLTHHQFVTERRAQIEQLKKKGVKPTAPLRHDNFVDGYPFVSEVGRFAQEFPQNKTYLDYLLCSLLLQKRVDVFGIILHKWETYKGKPLPRAYAEAAAAMESMGHSLRGDSIDYPADYDTQFAQFKQDQESGVMGLDIKYKGSYWYYLYNVQTPQESEQMNMGAQHN